MSSATLPSLALSARRRQAVLRAIVAVGATLSALEPCGALAQAAAATPQELNPADRLRPASRVPRTEDLLSPPEAGPCPIADAALQFRLTEVTFEGASSARPIDLGGSYQGRMGQKIDLQAVCDIRDRAAATLFRAGILARVEIPPQRIEDGRLTLRIIEARVVAVQVHGDAGPAQELVERYVNKLRGMQPFDIRQAQRYLLLASEIPGLRVTAALRAAPGGPGSVALLVNVARKPLDAVVNVQNAGSHTLGPAGAVARVDYNSATRFGERTSLIVFSTLDGKEQQVAQLLSEVRLDDDGLLARGSASYGWSAPGGVLTPIGLKGRALVVDTSLVWPIVKTRRLGLDLSAGFNLIDQKTTLGGGGLLNRDHLRVGYLRADLARAWRPQRGAERGATLTGGLEVRQGFANLGASRADDLDLSRVGGRADRMALRANVRLDLPLGDYLSARTIIAGQYAPAPLLAYEQFAVGAMTVGRGYDPAALIGDQGLAGSLEIAAGPFQSPVAGKRAWKAVGAAQPSVFGFYDVGAVSNHALGGINRTVRSAGAGLRLRIGARTRFEATYVQPLDKASIVAPDSPGPRFLFSLTSDVL